MGLVTAPSLFDRVFGELDCNVLTPLAAAPAIVRERTCAILVSIVICAIHVARSACFAIGVAQRRALSDLLRVQIEINLHFLVSTLSGLKFLPLGCGQLASMVLGEFREGLRREVTGRTRVRLGVILRQTLLSTHTGGSQIVLDGSLLVDVGLALHSVPGVRTVHRGRRCHHVVPLYRVASAIWANYAIWTDHFSAHRSLRMQCLLLWCASIY